MALSIGQVADLCGITQQTLRAWERRYSLPCPGRESNGYRSYSQEHADLLHRMARLVRVGMPPRYAARHVLGEHPPVPSSAPQEFAQQFSSGNWSYEALSTQLQAALGAIDLAAMADDWLMPMLQRVGDDWAAGRVGVDEEHLLTAAIMGQLSLLRDAAPAPRPVPVVLTGLPAGARHEIGILTFATVLRRAGWPAVYLGADLPDTAWGHAVRQHRAAAVVTAVPMQTDVEPAARLVRTLHHEFPQLLIGVGGACQDTIGNPAVVRLGHSFEAARDRFAILLGERVADASS